MLNQNDTTNKNEHGNDILCNANSKICYTASILDQQ